jgi:hypothetical protein
MYWQTVKSVAAAPIEGRGRAVRVGGPRGSDNAAQHRITNYAGPNDRRRTMRKLITAGATVALALAVAGPASASVTLDPSTGIGFVGKGDVQTAYGWNDQKLQDYASSVTFSYSKTTDEQYAVTCGWDTESTQGRDHQVVITHHVQNKRGNVNASVAYDPKSVSRNNPNGKVTGFKLTGFPDGQPVVTNEGTVPVVDESCPATGNADGTDNAVDKTIESVELLSSTSTEAFYANWNGDSRQLVYPTPVVAPVA